MTFSAGCHRRRRWKARDIKKAAARMPPPKSTRVGTGWSDWWPYQSKVSGRLGDQAEALALVHQHAGVDGRGPGEGGVGQHDAGDGARRGNHHHQRGRYDHLEHVSLPFVRRRTKPRRSPWERINPRLYPANVASVSSVSRPTISAIAVTDHLPPESNWPPKGPKATVLQALPWQKSPKLPEVWKVRAHAGAVRNHHGGGDVSSDSGRGCCHPLFVLCGRGPDARRDRSWRHGGRQLGPEAGRRAAGVPHHRRRVRRQGDQRPRRHQLPASAAPRCFNTASCNNRDYRSRRRRW